MIKICKKEFEPIFQSELEGDVKRSQSNVELAEKMINWESEIELEEGLKEFVNKYS